MKNETTVLRKLTKRNKAIIRERSSTKILLDTVQWEGADKSIHIDDLVESDMDE